jgi:hypothetical protein
MDVGGYVQDFNEAVGTGDWDAFADRFADDAAMEFRGPPVGPFVGKAAIWRAYAETPPTDTIELAGSPHEEGAVLVVPYRWCATGEPGTMRFEQTADGLISRLVITFG